MALVDRLRIHISDNNALNYKYSALELQEFIDYSFAVVNRLTDQSFVEANAPPQFSALVIQYAAICVLRNQAVKFGSAKKIQTQDTLVDPGDEGTRIAKMLAELLKEFKENAGLFYSIRTGFSGGVAIDPAADIADANLIIVG